MKWILTLICVNSLIAVMLYPMMTQGGGSATNWLLEAGFLLAGVISLYLLYRYRRSL